MAEWVSGKKLSDDAEVVMRCSSRCIKKDVRNGLSAALSSSRPAKSLEQPVSDRSEQTENNCEITVRRVGIGLP